MSNSKQKFNFNYIYKGTSRLVKKQTYTKIVNINGEIIKSLFYVLFLLCCIFVLKLVERDSTNG